MNLENIMQDAIALTKICGDFIQSESKKLGSFAIEVKGLHDLVSHVDKHAEQQLIKGLKALIPGSGVLAEESGSALEARFNWIIDPLDGTTNFLHGVPVYAISIALKEYDELIMGIVLELGRNECFYARKGAAAFLNGDEISVSSKNELDQSLVATGFPYHDFSRMQPYLQLFDQLMRKTRGIRRLGSAAADLAYVACGRFEAFYEYGLQPWDIAAGMFIVQQAGGKVSTFNGGAHALFGPDIIASNAHVHQQFLQEVAKAFK